MDNIVTLAKKRNDNPNNKPVPEKVKDKTDKQAQEFAKHFHNLIRTVFWRQWLDYRGGMKNCTQNVACDFLREIERAHAQMGVMIAHASLRFRQSDEQSPIKRTREMVQ